MKKFLKVGIIFSLIISLLATLSACSSNTVKISADEAKTYFINDGNKYANYKTGIRAYKLESFNDGDVITTTCVEVINTEKELYFMSNDTTQSTSSDYETIFKAMHYLDGTNIYGHIYDKEGLDENTRTSVAQGTDLASVSQAFSTFNTQELWEYFDEFFMLLGDADFGDYFTKITKTIFKDGNVEIKFDTEDLLAGGYFAFTFDTDNNFVRVEYNMTSEFFGGNIHIIIEATDGSDIVLPDEFFEKENW